MSILKSKETETKKENQSKKVKWKTTKNPAEKAMRGEKKSNTFFKAKKSEDVKESKQEVAKDTMPKEFDVNFYFSLLISEFNTRSEEEQKKILAGSYGFAMIDNEKWNSNHKIKAEVENPPVVVKENNEEEKKPEEKLRLMTQDQLSKNIETAKQRFNTIDFKIAKLIILALLYSADIIDQEIVYSNLNIETVTDSKEILRAINTVVFFFTGFVFSTASDKLQIGDIISAEDLNKITMFEDGYFAEMSEEVTIQEVAQNKLDAFVEKTRDNLINERKAQSNGEDIITPIMFINKNLKLNNFKGTDADRNLKQAFAPVLNYLAIPHHFDKLGSIYRLIVDDTTRPDEYRIDDGSIMGNGFCIEANVPNDTVFVSVDKHPKIVIKVLQNKSYVLSDEEYASVRNDTYNDPTIYQMVDMSQFNGINKLITSSDRDKVGKALSFIVHADAWFNGALRPSRLRFLNFKSATEFTLISDQYCMSPIAETLSNITDGLTVTVNKNSVTFVTPTFQIGYTIPGVSETETANPAIDYLKNHKNDSANN